MTQARDGRHASQGDGSAMLAMRVVSIGVGVFFLAMSLNKLAWLSDPDLLGQRFVRWLPTASPYARFYLENIAIPGTTVFARLVPIGEFLTALAMFSGVFTNLAAGLALFMVLNLHLATSSFSSVAFLRDGTGPVLIAALLALALCDTRLPYRMRK